MMKNLNRFVFIMMVAVFASCGGGKLMMDDGGGGPRGFSAEGGGIPGEEEKVVLESPFDCVSPMVQFGDIVGNYKPNETPELTFVNMLLNIPDKINQMVGVKGCKLQKACFAINAVDKCQVLADELLERCESAEDAEVESSDTHAVVSVSYCSKTRDEIIELCRDELPSTKSSMGLKKGVQITSMVFRIMTDEKCEFDTSTTLSKLPKELIAINDNNVVVALSMQTDVVKRALESTGGAYERRSEYRKVESRETEMELEDVDSKEFKNINLKKSKALLEKVKAEIFKEDLVISKPECWPSFTGDLSVAVSGKLTKSFIEQINCQCLAGALAFDKEKATLTFSALGDSDALLLGGNINVGYELISELTDMAFLKAINKE